MNDRPEQSCISMTVEGKGAFTMTLDLENAPNTSAQILGLVEQGFYDGIKFHRVIPGFVAQAGDPKTKHQPLSAPGIGAGGSGTTINFEANPLTHTDGAVGLARSQARDSGDSQFYICLGPQHGLDGNYVVFGQITDGMDVVRAIEVGDTISSATVA